jgi:hypothetical protein
MVIGMICRTVLAIGRVKARVIDILRGVERVVLREARFRCARRQKPEMAGGNDLVPRRAHWSIIDQFARAIGVDDKRARVGIGRPEELVGSLSAFQDGGIIADFRPQPGEILL